MQIEKPTRKNYEYKGVMIPFDLFEKDVMTNLTVIAKLNNVDLSNYFRTDETKIYIDKIIRLSDNPELMFGKSDPSNVTDLNTSDVTDLNQANQLGLKITNKINGKSDQANQLVRSKRKLLSSKKGVIETRRGRYDGGTWGNRMILIDFLKWIAKKDSDNFFDVWCISVIEQILTDKAILIYKNAMWGEVRGEKVSAAKRMASSLKDWFLSKHYRFPESEDYATMNDFANYLVLGYRARDFRQTFKLGENAVIGDFLNSKHLKALDEILNFISDLLDVGMEVEQIRDAAKVKFQKKYGNELSKFIPVKDGVFNSEYYLSYNKLAIE